MKRKLSSINERQFVDTAARVMQRCEQLAKFSEDTDCLTRTFCSPPMRQAHDSISNWMLQAGLTVHVDAAGNIIGQTSPDPNKLVLMVGSHLDTVVNAGKYDGPLGVLLGVAIAELVAATDFELAFEFAVVGFSEEEGVRFNTPYIGSKAVAGCFKNDMLEVTDDAGISIASALGSFGCNFREINQASFADRRLAGFLEVHIEQGPALELENCPVGIVAAIAGQTRASFTFSGQAGHAGTVPMAHRRDALAAAAQFILGVEEIGRDTIGLVATVGEVRVSPNVSNVIAGKTTLRLDLRHENDRVRESTFETLVSQAHAIARERKLSLETWINLDQPAVQMDSNFIKAFQDALTSLKLPPRIMPSGAGHDAAVMAQAAPTGMLFVRCREGISHHPDEHVDENDVVIALQVLWESIIRISDQHESKLN